jgi:triacylglycerol lipase
MNGPSAQHGPQAPDRSGSPEADFAIPAPSSIAFALSCMQLCRVSQGPFDRIKPDIEDPAFVAPWGDGRWVCSWGPAEDPVQANLALVADYVTPGDAAPAATVVVLRGTDMTGDVWGDLKEAFEDLLVVRQASPPWASDPGARVARGTLDALLAIEALRADGVGLLDFLAARLSKPAGVPGRLIVSGHSLGGCLATVAAPWLKSSLAMRGIEARILPITFAAPSAGNAAFAAAFAAEFPDCVQYFNGLDVVPRGWAELAATKTIYAESGSPAPGAVSIMIDIFTDAMRAAGSAYVQPPTPRTALTGIYQDGLDWYQQVGHQHHGETYLALLGDPAASIPPMRVRPRNRHQWKDEIVVVRSWFRRLLDAIGLGSWLRSRGA